MPARRSTTIIDQIAKDISEEKIRELANKPVHEEDAQKEDILEDDIDISSVQAQGETPSDILDSHVQDAPNFPKRKANIAIEHAVASIFSGSVRSLTALMFGMENAMLREEADSTVIPPIRMIQRRIEKYLKISLPFDKLDKKDKEDIEEFLMALATYGTRITVQWIEKIMAWLQGQVARKQANKPRPIAPISNISPEYRAALEKMRQENVVHSNGEMSPEQKAAMIANLTSDMGIE